MNTGGMFTSLKDDWATPRDIFERIDAVFHLTLDVAASHENAKCKDYICKYGIYQHRERMYHTKSADGCLGLKWPPGVYWMNPPYGRKIGPFVKHFVDQCRGNNGVMLLPARTDTAWFQGNVNGCAALFLSGRIHFEDGSAKPGPAPFPNMLVAVGRDRGKLRDVMLEGVYCASMEA